MKPRVLMLSQEVHPIPPTKGAAVEQWIDAVAHRLRTYEPHVVSVPHPHRPDREEVDGVHYHRIRIGRAYNRMFRKITRWDPYSYADRIVRYGREIRADIVHVQNAPRLFDQLAAGLRQARLILHMQNEKTDPVRMRPDALVGNSQYISDWFRARKMNAGRFMVLPNGVDTERLSPVLRAQAAPFARARYSIPAGRFIVLYVGRISPEKGPDLLAHAARLLDPAKFHFVFAGEWPRGDPSKSERVKYAQSLKRDLENFPNTVIDVVAPEDMLQIYALGDLEVIPSRFEEPFSMVAIEAMACGVPVLALRKGGMVEYMRHGENALQINGDSSPAQLAEAIRSAAGEPAKLGPIAERARQMVVERFTWERVAAETEAMYDLLLKS